MDFWDLISLDRAGGISDSLLISPDFPGQM